VILTLFAVYVPAFIYSLLHTSPYDIVADEIEIITREPVDGDERDVDPRYVNGNALKDPGEELDVKETIVVEEKSPQILKTLLTGLPSPTSTLWSGATLAINVALIAMMWDVVYRAKVFYPSHDLSMARVGYVSDSTANILVREPDFTKLPIFVSYRHADQPLRFDTSWKSGGSIDWLDITTDYTGVFELKGLHPDTRYQYVANNYTGFFTTAP
jgi:alkaline phosphatase D